jgi:hypothetical protein
MVLNITRRLCSTFTRSELLGYCSCRPNQTTDSHRMWRAKDEECPTSRAPKRRITARSDQIKRPTQTRTRRVQDEDGHSNITRPELLGTVCSGKIKGRPTPQLSRSKPRALLALRISKCKGTVHADRSKRPNYIACSTLHATKM